MADRPILFSAPMVRALLDGRKTQTRRILKPQPTGNQDLAGCRWRFTSGYKTTPADPPYMEAVRPHSYGVEIVAGPRRVPCRLGDRLWVRESGHLLREAYDSQPGVGDLYRDAGFVHSADGAVVAARDYSTPIAEWIGDCAKINRPSIHMPRWASRLTLLVTEVRVQRLQDISEADAVAEGASEVANGWSYGVSGVTPLSGSTARGAFYCLWNSINGPESWDANPWICAVTFTVHRCNIDRMGGEG